MVWRPCMGSAGPWMASVGPSRVLFFYFFMINKGGHKTASENPPLIEALARRRTQKPPPRINFDCIQKYFFVVVGVEGVGGVVGGDEGHAGQEEEGGYGRGSKDLVARSLATPGPPDTS